MDGMLSAEEIDALLRMPLGSGPEEGEEIDALMNELTGGKEVEKAGTAYNPIDRTDGIVRETKDNILAVYERGYKDGKADAYETGRRDAEEMMRAVDEALQKEEIYRQRERQEELAEKEYQRGLDEAWETIRKIWTMPISKQMDIFGMETMNEIINNLTVSVALEKIRAWEEKQVNTKGTNRPKFIAGDEVEIKEPTNEAETVGIIYKVEAQFGNYYVDFGNGQITCFAEGEIDGTGRNFEQIAKILGEGAYQ